MSNHVHYLIEPGNPQDLPRIMHWLNWYTAMCFNRMLNRTGHFWEQRYHSSAFPTADHQRALNVLRYIHANPKAAGISSGFGYRYSNYATYEKLTDDQLTEWHPAFLRMGRTLAECAARYRAFCRGCRIETKSGGRRSFWAQKWLPDVRTRRAKDTSVPGQMGLWGRCQVQNGSALPDVPSSRMPRARPVVVGNLLTQPPRYSIRQLWYCARHTGPHSPFTRIIGPRL